MHIGRFKDDAVISTDYTSDGSTYVVGSASLDDTGYYQCRASNDNGAIYSTIVTVLVKGRI